MKQNMEESSFNLCKFGMLSIVCLTSKETKVFSKNLLVKSSESNFFITCILPDYMAQRHPQRFQEAFKYTHIPFFFQELTVVTFQLVQWLENILEDLLTIQIYVPNYRQIATS